MTTPSPEDYEVGVNLSARIFDECVKEFGLGFVAKRQDAANLIAQALYDQREKDAVIAEEFEPEKGCYQNDIGEYYSCNSCSYDIATAIRNQKGR